MHSSDLVLSELYLNGIKKVVDMNIFFLYQKQIAISSRVLCSTYIHTYIHTHIRGKCAIFSQQTHILCINIIKLQ